MSETPTSTEPPTYSSFEDFYPDYLADHQNRTSRVLHFVGTILAVGTIIACTIFRMPWGLLAVPLFGYGFAWLGHFVFEKNKPASFRYPLYSLRGDFKMLKDALTGRLPF